MVVSSTLASEPRFSATVAGLFPPGVSAAELYGAADESALTEEEARCCATFAPKRVADFAAGRACAHLALEMLGYPNRSLPIDVDRRPRWPAGIIGSISHTEGYCAAVAARAGHVRSLGFDAERIGRVTQELWPKLFTEREAAWLAALPYDHRASAATLLFSAKEAFYKFRFHLDPAWLDFTDAEVDVPRLEETGSFAVRLVRDVARAKLFDGGRYAVVKNFVFAGISASEF